MRRGGRASPRSYKSTDLSDLAHGTCSGFAGRRGSDGEAQAAPSGRTRIAGCPPPGIQVFVPEQGETEEVVAGDSSSCASTVAEATIEATIVTNENNLICAVLPYSE